MGIHEQRHRVTITPTTQNPLELVARDLWALRECDACPEFLVLLPGCLKRLECVVELLAGLGKLLSLLLVELSCANGNT